MVRGSHFAILLATPGSPNNQVGVSAITTSPLAPALLHQQQTCSKNLLHLVSPAVVVQSTNPWSGDPPLFYRQWLQEVLFSALLSKLWVQLAVHGVSLGD
jgi:hypothetical protein